MTTLYIYDFSKLKEELVGYLVAGLVPLGGYSADSVGSINWKVDRDGMLEKPINGLPFIGVSLSGLAENNTASMGTHRVGFNLFIIADADNKLSAEDRALAVLSDVMFVAQDFTTPHSQGQLSIDSVGNEIDPALLSMNLCVYRIDASIRINTKQRHCVEQNSFPVDAPQGAISVGIFATVCGESKVK